VATRPILLVCLLNARFLLSLTLCTGDARGAAARAARRAGIMAAETGSGAAAAADEWRRRLAGWRLAVRLERESMMRRSDSKASM